MVDGNDEYKPYDVTIPVTFHVEATSQKSALDIVAQAMNKISNFYIVRNAHFSLSNAKITELSHKTIYHSK